MVLVHRSLILLGLVLAAFAPALAPAADDGHVDDPFGQYRVVLDVSANDAATQGWRVSGTKVDVASTPRAYEKYIGPTPPYDGITLKSAELKINGDRVAFSDGSEGGLLRGSGGGSGGGEVDSRPPPEEWIGVNIEARPVPLRFASTNFNDGAAITIEYVTVWGLHKNGVELTTHTTTARLAVTAYNRVLAWKFTRFADGTKLTEPWVTARDEVMSAGATVYSDAHYFEEILDRGTHLLNRDEIPDHPQKATSLFTDTHGSPTGAMDSGEEGGPTASNGRYVLWTRLVSSPEPVWNQTVHPLGLALATVYGCSTLPAGNGAVAIEIKNMSWRKENGVLVDSVYAGFSMTIYGVYPQDPNVPNSPIIYRLGQHTVAFYNALKAGKTVEAARLAANKTVTDNIPFSHPWGQPLMTLYGDPLMTLTDVYLYQAERSNLGLGPDQPSGHWYYPWTNP